ncbi:universal stress protein Sll1388-like isoform X2 [Physella acuta]|nr:universal stress protein Sll1388-like isoform X2 [Physella acuta]XP_059165550.1 universal stress protein Sll1388-like isoform X2 [Physella acuta]XP_059165551.1 universal stress protein Sll1388-like isoform X2 [Physella acuta]XP_059165552.1 universal stress protein Sll1388-like isoform X2 [Physella acuta]XP_059165553.1 universal stress protein Sll1388-like isoform X2 [Physella acuta]XP_059165554.1 universal stress protein Sll1388-like isoform X2 [Physella acuta]XP_059165555.1 universal stre
MSTVVNNDVMIAEEQNKEMCEQRRVLVGMDGSKDSNTAFDWYIENIYRPGDIVIIGYCPAAGSTFHFENFLTSLHNHMTEMQDKAKEVRRLLEEKLEKLGAKGYVETLAGSNAGVALVKEAEKEKVELIVVGSRGHGALRRTVLGSVSGYIVHHSNVPVLVYPPLNHALLHSTNKHEDKVIQEHKKEEGYNTHL